MQVTETLGKDHGRIERRRLIATSRLNDYLDWPGVQQVCRLESRTRRQGVWTTTIRYAVTSVPRDRADAAQLLQWWRRLWHIENRLHWVRDETFGEDRSRIRTGSAPQAMAALRNLVINSTTPGQPSGQWHGMVWLR